ncbi:MAG TPA: tRNA pseudouridine(55) synthase TruB [Acidimicrobiales bacterium]
MVDKDEGWTSHDVVARCRRLVGQRRVGHAGTLDPAATGLLLVGLGRVTRLLRFLGALPKSYAGEVVLGSTTSTLDDQGDVVERFDMPGVTVDQAREAAHTLTGDIMQTPPMVSARKVAGRRLYQLAREGVEVERSARPVTVSRFDVERTDDPGVFAIEVDCSSGTYVRTLAADLGAALGGGAHLRGLRRLAIGSFTVADARRLDELSPDSVVASVLSPTEAMRDYLQLRVDDGMAQAVGHGAKLDRTDVGAVGEGPWAVVDGRRRLLAVYEQGDDTRLKAAVVLVTSQ